jgi:hypothetical protein
VAKVDSSVAVIVDAVFDVGRRQELGLADLARIRADQLALREIATLDDLQCLCGLLRLFLPEEVD